MEENEEIEKAKEEIVAEETALMEESIIEEASETTAVSEFEKKPLIGRIFSWLFTIVLLLVVIFAVMAILNRDGNGTKIGPYRFLSVLTGSMEPTISTGSFIITQEIAEGGSVAVGDIITYEPLDDSNILVTHRIVEANAEGTEFVTQGDANNARDRGTVSYDAIVGKFIFAIPWLGGLVLFLKTPTGIFFTVAVFVAYIIFEELLTRYARKK